MIVEGWLPKGKKLHDLAAKPTELPKNSPDYVAVQNFLDELLCAAYIRRTGIDAVPQPPPRDGDF